MNNATYESPDIGNIRNLKGYDKAVVRLGNTMAMKEFTGYLKNSDYFSRLETITEITKLYSGKDYGDHQYQKNAGSFTEPNKLTMYGEFRKKYMHLSPLSLDPGFMSHLNEFMSFMDKMCIIGDSNYYDIRLAFSEHLGYKEVWKGAMLTEEQAEELKENGITSDFANKLQDNSNRLLEFEANIISADINELYRTHYLGENEITPFISVYDNREKAIAIGRDYGKNNKGKIFYLFKIKLPKIDLISYSEQNTTKKSFGGLIKGILGGTQNQNDTKQELATDKSFVFWKINPEEILDTIPKINVK